MENKVSDKEFLLAMEAIGWQNKNTKEDISSKSNFWVKAWWNFARGTVVLDEVVGIFCGHFQLCFYNINKFSVVLQKYYNAICKADWLKFPSS